MPQVMLRPALNDIIMETHVGTFQNAKEVNISGGNFAINHNTIKRESNTDIKCACLFIASAAPNRPHA